MAIYEGPLDEPPDLRMSVLQAFYIVKNNLNALCILSEIGDLKDIAQKLKCGAVHLYCNCCIMKHSLTFHYKLQCHKKLYHIFLISRFHIFMQTWIEQQMIKVLKSMYLLHPLYRIIISSQHDLMAQIQTY